jgi:uncharacterized protein with PIN domain
MFHCPVCDGRLEKIATVMANLGTNLQNEDFWDCCVCDLLCDMESLKNLIITE